MLIRALTGLCPDEEGKQSFFGKKGPKNFAPSLFQLDSGMIGSRLVASAWEQKSFGSFCKKARLAFFFLGTFAFELGRSSHLLCHSSRSTRRLAR